jgi:hypothetical protein
MKSLSNKHVNNYWSIDSGTISLQISAVTSKRKSNNGDALIPQKCNERAGHAVLTGGISPLLTSESLQAAENGRHRFKWQ